MEFDYKLIQLANNRGTSLVDKEDYNEINKYRWNLHPSGYATRSSCKEERRCGHPSNIYMHRQIMGLSFVSKLTDVDHINGDKLDNRRSYIRTCSRAENNRNKPLQSNNKSGIRGVCWYETRNKWHAQIWIHDKKIHLGYYADIEDARIARKEAELKLGWLPITNNKRNNTE